MSGGGFRSLHPSVALLFYSGLLLLTALLVHPVYLLTGLLALTALLVMQGQGGRLLRGLPFYLLMAGSVAVLNPLFSHRGSHILFYLWDNPITLEAILYGLLMMLVLLTLFILFISYNYTVTADKFMYLFAGIAPRSALLTLMVLRFVPLFQRRLRQITMLQRTRGIDTGTGNLRKRMKDGMTLLKVLLTWSLEEALQTADSMKARGYGVRRRSVYGVYRLERRDILLLLWLAATGLIAVSGWLQGHGVLEIYPRIRQTDWSWGESVTYAAFCLFIVVPLYVEGKEKWLWKSSLRSDYPSGIPMKSGIRFTGFRSR